MLAQRAVLLDLEAGGVVYRGLELRRVAGSARLLRFAVVRDRADDDELLAGARAHLVEAQRLARLRRRQRDPGSVRRVWSRAGRAGRVWGHTGRARRPGLRASAGVACVRRLAGTQLHGIRQRNTGAAQAPPHKAAILNRHNQAGEPAARRLLHLQ